MLFFYSYIKLTLYYQEKLLTRIPLLEVDYVEGPITEDDFSNSFELKYPLRDNVSYNYADCMSDEKAADALFHYICCMKEKVTWGMEEELRLVAALDVLRGRNRLSSQQGFQYLDTGYKIPIPPNCVKEIILGHNFDTKNFYIIRNCLKIIQ